MTDDEIGDVVGKEIDRYLLSNILIQVVTENWEQNLPLRVSDAESWVGGKDEDLRWKVIE